jgi:hypothetical protein
MKIYRSDRPAFSSGGKVKSARTNPDSAKKYVNDAHEWMDKNILHGRSPDLYGFLILMDHSIPPDEIWDQLKLWSEQYNEFGENRTRICHRIIDKIIEYQLDIDRMVTGLLSAAGDVRTAASSPLPAQMKRRRLSTATA